VEDIAWSPTEETVFASGSADACIAVWDTRDRGKPQIVLPSAHGASGGDINCVAWNGCVTYMMASGADDGSLRIWDLRSFTTVSTVAGFLRGPSGAPGKLWEWGHQGMEAAWVCQVLVSRCLSGEERTPGDQCAALRPTAAQC
jgi:WD40 repeat protein